MANWHVLLLKSQDVLLTRSDISKPTSFIPDGHIVSRYPMKEAILHWRIDISVRPQRMSNGWLNASSARRASRFCADILIYLRNQGACCPPKSPKFGACKW